MRKRSRYRPKPVRLDAVSWVVNGFLPVSEAADAVLVLRTKNHGALTSICQGTGTVADVTVLTHALITTRSLAELGTGRDWLPEIEAGQEALLSLLERGQRLGGKRFVFTGPELRAINLAMEVHDAQIDGCTVQKFEQAILHAKAAIRRSQQPVAA